MKLAGNDLKSKSDATKINLWIITMKRQKD